MRLARRYDSGSVPTQQPTRAPGTDAVDVAAFTPIAAWVRTRDGEPALRTMCAAAGIDSHLLAGSGGSLPLARLEAFLAALREHTGSDDALLVASGAVGEAPGRGRWLRWFATPGLPYRSRARGGWLTRGGGRNDRWARVDISHVLGRIGRGRARRRPRVRARDTTHARGQPRDRGRVRLRVPSGDDRAGAAGTSQRASRAGRRITERA